MGRIKTTLIKRTGRKAFNEKGSEFTENFEENKKKVSEVVDIHSKKLRNVLAGYLTKLKKQKSKA